MHILRQQPLEVIVITMAGRVPVKEAVVVGAVGSREYPALDAITDIVSCPAFTVSGYCPGDPPDVKCCISQTCRKSTPGSGLCLNNPGSSCSGTWVKGLCPGPSDVQCCITDYTPFVSNSVNVIFWIKAFIPLTFETVTKPWPNHKGMTMISGIDPKLQWVPNFGGCFVTDQRDFSYDRYASQRMHSEAQVIIENSYYKFTQVHRCGETVKVDCVSGKERDHATASTSEMNYTLVKGNADKVVLNYIGKASDPLVFGAPKIDIEGTLTVDRVNRYVQFVGKVDDFPSFEAYAIVNGLGPRRFATLGPKPGSDATSLLGGANRVFSGIVQF